MSTFMDRRLLIAVLAIAAAGANAQSYRVDTGAQFVTGSIDGFRSGLPDYTPPPTGAPETPPETPTETPLETPGGDEDFSGWRVSGDVFLSDVDTSKGPLRLAPFLSRASSIGGSYEQLETDDTDLEITTWLLDARFVTSNGIVIEAAFGQREDELGGAEDDVDLFGLTAGYYVADNTEIAVGFERGDGDLEEFNRYLVSLTHVQQMENGMTWSVDAEFGFNDADVGAASDDGWDLGVHSAWFFNDSTAVGLDLNYVDLDSTGELMTYEVYANYFVTEKISLNLAYRVEDYDEFDLDTDAWTFEARYRF